MNDTIKNKNFTRSNRSKASLRVSEHGISCFDCRYYLNKEYTCMYMWDVTCIKDEWETAQKCKNFRIGEYDEDLIEREYWDNSL